MPTVTIEQIEAEIGQHEAGDKRKPTRYAVLVDGRRIGTVASRSRASYRSDRTTSRIRSGFQGYSRTWVAEIEHKVGSTERVPWSQRTVTRYAYKRQKAIDELVAAATA